MSEGLSVRQHCAGDVQSRKTRLFGSTALGAFSVQRLDPLAILLSWCSMSKDFVLWQHCSETFRCPRTVIHGSITSGALNGHYPKLYALSSCCSLTSYPQIMLTTTSRYLRRETHHSRVPPRASWLHPPPIKARARQWGRIQSPSCQGRRGRARKAIPISVKRHRW